jgi:hypothetical protein
MKQAKTQRIQILYLNLLAQPLASKINEKHKKFIQMTMLKRIVRCILHLNIFSHAVSENSKLKTF